jgi:hypothetical protein
VADAIPVLERGAMIVEGNWLLQEEPGIPNLRSKADLTIFVECSEALSLAALRARYVRAGRDRADALRHIEEVDAPNWRRVTGGGSTKRKPSRPRAPGAPCEPRADIVLRVGRRRGLRAVRVAWPVDR